MLRKTYLKRSPLKRSSKPIRKVRAKTRRGEPTKAEKTAIRDQVYVESCGKCQIRKHPQCSGERVLPSDGEVMYRWHLVHKKAKRVHGWGRENLMGGCYWCHIVFLHAQSGMEKIIPKKKRD